MDACLGTLGFQCTTSNTGIYVKHTAKSHIFLVLYVDDITIFGSNLAEVLDLKQALSATFQMTDLGETKNYLRLEVTHDHVHKKLSLCQSRYITDILS